MKIKYDLKEIAQDVYLCTIKDHYDLCMTFCRVQEFYESPYKNIRGKSFELIDFIKAYAKDNNGSFTYPADWAGFNIPGTIVEKMFKRGIIDFNRYDATIKQIHNRIGKSRYYLIAAKTNDKNTVQHELCHAFYFLDKNFRKHVNKIIKQLSISTFRKLEHALLKIGYCKRVVKDEIQAYLITGDEILKAYSTLNKREKDNIKEVKKQLVHFYKQYRIKNKFTK